MALRNPFYKEKPEQKVIPHIYKSPAIEATSYLTQSTGLVEQKTTLQLKGLGEVHPFDAKFTEAIYCKVPIIFGAVNKYVDYIVGPGIYVRSKDESVEKAINNWLRINQFTSILRDWVKEALIKPGGYMELGGAPSSPTEKKRMKILDGKYMFIKRNDKGAIEAYKQYVGGFKQFEKEKFITFKPIEIASLHFNKVGSSPYGLGIVNPVCGCVNDLLGAEKHMHRLMERKANSPLHIKLGIITPDGQIIKPDPSEIDKFGQDLEVLTNRTEFATGPETEFKVVDFGTIAEKFQFVLEHDIKMLVFGLQIPEVIFGSGNIAEGLAKEQSDAHEKVILSMREEVEKVLEEQVFKVIVGREDIEVEVEWGVPSSNEKNARLEKLTSLLSNSQLQPVLRNLVERDIAKILEYEADLLLEPEDERSHEKEVEDDNGEAGGQSSGPAKDAGTSKGKRPAPKFGRR